MYQILSVQASAYKEFCEANLSKEVLNVCSQILLNIIRDIIAQYTFINSRLRRVLLFSDPPC